MWISVDNLAGKVVKGTDEERQWLQDYLSFPDAGARFKLRRMPSWKRGDGKIHMLHAVYNTFPAGFVSQVVKAASEEGLEVKLLDRRTRPAPPDPSALIDWLRWYQRDAIDVARQHERGVFHHPTGAGKTEVMVAVGELYPIRWLIVSHSKDLILQTAQRFAKRTGEETGQIGEGVFNPRRITVATFQSIYSKLRGREMRAFLESVQGVMVDEAHTTPARTFWAVLQALPNAYFRYGFSGTPFARGDKKSIFTWGALGPTIHRIKAQVLIDEGVLAQPDIRLIPVRHPPVAVSGWSDAYSKLIVKSAARNQAVLEAARRATKPSFLFVNHIEHGKTLSRMLSDLGISNEFVWGKVNTHARRATLERLVHGMTDVVVCNTVFQEGIDVPELQSIVIAQGGKSVIAALQRVGRGTRRHAANGEVTKDHFVVYDVKDIGCGCRDPKRHPACRWVEKHTRTRVAAYGSESYPVREEALAGRGIGVQVSLAP